MSAKVRQTYATRLSQLQSFVKENQLGFETDEQVDQVLVDYFNVKFKEGEGSSYGDYTMAALMDKLPQFGAAGWTKSASGMEMSPRLEKALPISLEACLSPQPPPGLDLPPLMKLRKLGLVRPTRGITSFWSVVTSLAETSDISKTGSKDDSVLIDSQWSIFANPLFEELARGDKMEFVFKFDYPSYLKVFREACRDLRLEIVPYQTRHSGPSIDRAKKREDPGGGSQKRKLDEQTERGSLRESGEISGHLAEAGCGSAAGMQVGRAIHRGDYARPKLSGDPSPWPVRKGSYFADLFAGSGRIGHAANRLGFQTRSWELDWGANHDLPNKRVLSKIKLDINKRIVLGGMIAPPCISFSIARDRAGIIRTEEFPWGLPGLTKSDQEKVTVGNKCMRSAFALIRAFDSHSLPWIFEHPNTSKAWFLPELRRLQGMSHVQVVVTDLCQWGTKWRKRTRFLLGNVAEDDAAGCSRLCQGEHGGCSRSGRTHLVLTGKDAHGRNLTQVAQPYPHPLCHRLVRAALSQYMIIPSL